MQNCVVPAKAGTTKEVVTAASARNDDIIITFLLEFPVIPRHPSARHTNKEQENDRSRGPGISGPPWAHHHARRSFAGDASSGDRHLFRRDARDDRQPAARSVKTVRNQGPVLHLYRQRPWRLGRRAVQRAV